MEPSAAIAVIEVDLRRLADRILQEKIGPNWLEQVLDADRIEELARRRDEEAKRRAPAQVPRDLLAYTHLYELRRILDKRWQDFAPALGAKRSAQALLDRVEDYRNAPAHSRELLPHERELLAGIAGLIRTQVTTHMSTQGPDAQHYPVIESIRDHFGNAPESLDPARRTIMVSTSLRLTVGTVLKFDARGWDPQGRELSWAVYGGAHTCTPVTGNDLQLVYEVKEEDVGAALFLDIEVTSSGKYHRYHTYDQRVAFEYAVDPPTV